MCVCVCGGSVGACEGAWLRCVGECMCVCVCEDADVFNLDAYTSNLKRFVNMGTIEQATERASMLAIERQR